jgi:hypothetical protein
MARKLRNKPELGCLEQLIVSYFAKRPDPILLQEHVDLHMSAFEEFETKRLAEEIGPDGEGFVTVQSGSKKRVFAPLVNNNSNKSNSKNYELTDFYKFQIKKAKFGDIDTLKERFNRDLQMIASLRANKII